MKQHWITVNKVFRYLCGTTSYGLCYQGRPRLDKVLDIHGFVDADWAGDMDHIILQVGMCLTYLEDQSVG